MAVAAKQVGYPLTVLYVGLRGRQSCVNCRHVSPIVSFLGNCLVPQIYSHILARTHLQFTNSIYMVPCPVLPPPPPMVWVPPPPPIPHTFCTRHCSETCISILLHARRCSETHIFILLDEPSRRIRWVDRAKLWRNANFKLQELLRAVYRTLQCSANGIIYIYISMYIHIHKHQ